MASSAREPALSPSLSLISGTQAKCKGREPLPQPRFLSDLEHGPPLGFLLSSWPEEDLPAAALAPQRKSAQRRYGEGWGPGATSLPDARAHLLCFLTGGLQKGLPGWMHS